VQSLSGAYTLALPMLGLALVLGTGCNGQESATSPAPAPKPAADAKDRPKSHQWMTRAGIDEQVSSKIPHFPWPPPEASARQRIPSDRLRGTNPKISLLGVARRLEAAFDQAGYGEIAYYFVPKGFAIVSRLEQIKPDGTPLDVPDRWSREIAPPPVYSLRAYIEALFSANPGHFRVVVFIVTSEPFAEDTNTQVTRDEALKWLVRGSNKLP
jgi:hypothetical protein